MSMGRRSFLGRLGAVAAGLIGAKVAEQLPSPTPPPRIDFGGTLAASTSTLGALRIAGGMDLDPSMKLIPGRLYYATGLESWEDHGGGLYTVTRRLPSGPGFLNLTAQQVES